MKRTITGFICGLIGSLFSLWWGFSCGWIGSIITSIVGSGNVGAEIYAFGWIAFLGGIVGIVGSALCLKKAGKGAICLTVASVMCGMLQIDLFARTFSNGFAISNIFLFLLPFVLLVVATVFAWLAKDVMIKASQGTNVSNKKSLEDEITDLKAMLDKGLLTEQEFAEAKKSVLDKYMQ